MRGRSRRVGAESKVPCTDGVMGEGGEGGSDEFSGGTVHGATLSVGTSGASLVGGSVFGVSAGVFIVVGCDSSVA